MENIANFANEMSPDALTEAGQKLLVTTAKLTTELRGKRKVSYVIHFCPVNLLPVIHNRRLHILGTDWCYRKKLNI